MRLAFAVLLVACSSSSTPEDAGADTTPADGGFDANVDGGFDGGTDGGLDASSDTGFDADFDAGFDGGADASFDAGLDGGPDAFDAGPPDIDGDGVSADEDCNDADPDNWMSCATCVDGDADRRYVGCDRYITREGPDCDDDNRSVFRSVDVFPDADGDGRGSGTRIDTRCIGVVGVNIGEAIGDGDCDETHELRRAGMPELPDDGIDNDCDGSDRSALDDDGIYVAIEHPDCQDLMAGTRPLPNCTLGAALGFSTEGDAIYLAEGTYSDGIDTHSRSFFGGYDSSDWTLGATTVLDPPATIRLDGVVAMTNLTVRNEIITDGALFIDACEVTRVVGGYQQLLFVNSEATRGLVLSFTPTLVIRSVVSHPDAEGIYNNVSTPVYVRESTVSGLTGCRADAGNTVIERSSCIGTDRYGALFFNGEAFVSNSYFRGGTGATSYGLFDNGNTTIINSTIDAGEGTNRRVGLALTSVGERTFAINNVIVVRGMASERTAGVEPRAFLNDGRLFNNLIYVPMGDVAHYESVGGPVSLAELNACTWTGCTAAGSNIAVDPMLAADGIHLLSGSPAIDQGVDPSTVSGGFAVSEDFDADARPSGLGWDIGADEAP